MAAANLTPLLEATPLFIDHARTLCPEGRPDSYPRFNNSFKNAFDPAERT